MQDDRLLHRALVRADVIQAVCDGRHANALTQVNISCADLCSLVVYDIQ